MLFKPTGENRGDTTGGPGQCVAGLHILYAKGVALSQECSLLSLHTQ